MDLVGNQKRQLRDALIKAYPTYKSMAQMVYFELDLELARVAADGNMEDVAFELIVWAEKTGKTKDLLVKAAEADGGNPDLRGLVDVFTKPGGHKVQAANAGIVTAREILESSPKTELTKRVVVRAAVFRTLFQTAREQITQVADYKELHDILHEVQKGSYDQIALAVEKFPEQPDDVRRDIRDYRSTLGDYVTRVRDVETRGVKGVSGEAEYVRKELEQVGDRLRAGADGSDPKGLPDGLRLLTNLLSRRPQMIDRALFDTSEALPLQELAKALGDVCGEVERLGLDAEKAAVFREGVENLTDLGMNLRSMIKVHHRWQEVDLLLRSVEFRIQISAAELESVWPELRPQAEELARASKDGWGPDFLEMTRELDGDLMSKEMKRILKSFKRCRRRAADRFFYVDKTLREQCGQLRTICEPLSSFLEMIA